MRNQGCQDPKTRKRTQEEMFTHSWWTNSTTSRTILPIHNPCRTSIPNNSPSTLPKLSPTTTTQLPSPSTNPSSILSSPKTILPTKLSTTTPSTKTRTFLWPKIPWLNYPRKTKQSNLSEQISYHIIEWKKSWLIVPVVKTAPSQHKKRYTFQRSTNRAFRPSLFISTALYHLFNIVRKSRSMFYLLVYKCFQNAYVIWTRYLLQYI